MSGGEPSAEPVEALLERYVERHVLQGVVPDPEELCRDSPELLEPLRACIREYERLGRALAPPGDLGAGEALLHYRIVEKLGGGGMGQVYAAEDTKLGRRVALKLLPPEMAADRERLERFRREARAVAAFNHPNVVTLHSLEEADELHVLVMELVKGTTLARKIPDRGMPPDEIFDLAIPVADALAASHARGIVHRDLKPSNVMVTDDGQVKVLDFGLAKLTERPVEDETEEHVTPLTQTGCILGTAQYMSPEQVQGMPAEARSDIFSLGVILYQMATGRRPFHGESPAELISSIVFEVPPPLTELRSDLPLRLGAIIERCLEKEPERRYPSARDVRDELVDLEREVAAGEAVSASDDATVIEPSRRVAGWLWLPALIAAAVLLALVLVYL